MRDDGGKAAPSTTAARGEIFAQLGLGVSLVGGAVLNLVHRDPHEPVILYVSIFVAIVALAVVVKAVIAWRAIGSRERIGGGERGAEREEEGRGPKPGGPAPPRAT